MTLQFIDCIYAARGSHFFSAYLLHPIYIAISRKTGSCTYSEKILSICISKCNNKSKDSTNSLCGKILIGLASDPVQSFHQYYRFAILHLCFEVIRLLTSKKMIQDHKTRRCGLLFQVPFGKKCIFRCL